ncbi:uncharacterized protein LOC129236997 [Anastrepha obliqua]|uniref:uncharacterized protein LOC129236997 n=1 Tax=Anastrepha obliqua TaxID=95512 RepID=UPI00240928E1|nr:uncharacterized protein LOC129236997 [Anastrepha obliqua]
MHGNFVLIFILEYLSKSYATNAYGIVAPDTVCNSTIRHNVRYALWAVIAEHFVPNSSELLISVHAKHQQAWRLMQDLLTCALPFMNNIKVQLETMDLPRLPTYARHHNLLLIDSMQALVELDPALLTKKFDFPEQYLILLIGADPTLVPNLLVSSILSYFWQNYIINVSLLFESKPNYVKVYTYFPFFENSTCKANNVRVINAYNNSWQKPLATDIFPKKLLNMQNCSLTVAVWDAPPYLSYNPNKSGYAQLGYFEGEMLIELAKKLNFSMDLLEPANDEQRGLRLANGTLTGAMKLLDDHLADMSLGCFRYTIERCEVLTGALPYYQSWQIFGVKLAGKTYTSLEILAFPFDLRTWLCLLLSLQITLLLAYTINYCSNYSQLARIIIGYPRPRTPLTNTYSLFLGVPILHAPRTNFARFVLIMWVIYGYVMRNAYQSFLYKLLQTDLYRTPPTDIFQLINEDYSLIMTETTFNTVSNAPLIQNKRIPIIINNSTYEWKSYEMVEKLGGNLAGVSPKDYLTYYLMSQRKRGTFYVLPDRFFQQYITMYFSKHSYLIARFNELLMQLRSQGLIDYWAHKHIDLSYYELSSAEDDDALEMDDLWGVFAIYLVLISLAGIAFIAELLCHRLTN